MPPEAQRHFQSNFDRRRPAIRKKDVFKLRRRDRNEMPRKLFRRLVRKASEDHLVEAIHLVLDRLHNVRMTMTMGYDPPRRNGVEDTATIGGLEPGALTSGDWRRLGLHGMLSERMPYRRHRFHPAESFRKSSILKWRAKAARNTSPVSGSRCGRRPRRRAYPISTMMRSDSAFSSPMKTTPRSAIPPPPPPPTAKRAPSKRTRYQRAQTPPRP